METEEVQESIEVQETPTETVEATDPGEIIQPAEPPAAEDDDPEVTAELLELGLEPDKKGRVSKRIKQLVAKRRQEEEARRLAEEERDAWRGETQRLVRAQTPPELPPIQVDTSDLPMPDYDDFENESEYQAAMMRRAAIVALREEKARDQQRTDAVRQQEFANKLDSWKQAGRQKFADFDVALRDEVRITPAMGQVLLEHEMGHDLAYFLGKHPEEAYRISNLPENLQRLAVSNLAGKVSRPKPKTESTAPTSSSPVDAGRELVTKPKSIYDPDISFADYEKLRMKQLRERMGGA